MNSGKLLWSPDLRVRMPLLLALALTVVSAAGWHALATLKGANASVLALYADRVVPLIQLRAVGDRYVHEVFDSAREVQQGRLAPATARARVQGAREAAQRDWQGYLRTYLVPDELALVARTEPLLAAAHAASLRLERALEAGDLDAVGRAERDELRAVFDPLNGAVGELMQLQERVARDEAAAARAAYDRATLRTLAGLAIALVAGAALIALIAANYLRERRAETHRLRHQARLLAALSRVNQAIVRLRDEASLFEELCLICVDTGQAHYAVALRLDGGNPVLAAHAGPAQALALLDRCTLAAAAAPGVPGCLALYGGEACFVDDIVAIAGMAPWHAAAVAHGVRGLATLPIRVDGQPYASLGVGVLERDFFDSGTRGLLAEIASDIGYALESLRRVHERQQAVQALEESARRFARIFDALPVSAALIDLGNYELLEANPVYCKRYRMTHEEAIGRTLPALGLQTNERLFGRLRAGESVRSFELAVASNPPLMLLVNGEPVTYGGRACALIAALDITERKQAERLLGEREARLAGIVESAADAIVTLDGRLRVVVFNRAAGRMFGISAHDAIGHALLKRFTPPKLLARRVAILRRLLQKGSQAQYDDDAGDGACLRADGSQFFVRASLSTSGDGEHRLVSIVLQDLSAEHATERAHAAQHAAEVANRAKTDFLSRMSHELRTPLNAVLGYSQLLQGDVDPALSPDQALKVSAIRDAGWHLLALINDVLDVSRIEAGQLTLERSAVELAPLLDEVLEMMGPAARSGGVHLEPAYRLRSARITVLGDRLRLRQAAVNLVSNAIKYNRPHGRVVVDMARDGEQVVLTVVDTGIGMSALQLSHLFEPFNRLGREMSDIEGTGVGLALTRQLIEMMGGQIEVTSRTDAGTTVRLVLRATPDEGTAQVGHSTTIPGQLDVAAALHGRVLYAEDNAVNAMIVEQLLLRWPGVELTIAETGEQAIALARAIQPDLVLLDLRLGDMNGLQVLDALRRDPATRELRVVVLSASAMPEEIEAARQRGAIDYWTKPIDFKRFVRDMHQLLGAATV